MTSSDVPNDQRRERERRPPSFATTSYADCQRCGGSCVWVAVTTGGGWWSHKTKQSNRHKPVITECPGAGGLSVLTSLKPAWGRCNYCRRKFRLKAWRLPAHELEVASAH